MNKRIALTASILFLSIQLMAQYTLDWLQSSDEAQKQSIMSTVDSQDNIIVTGFWQSYQIFTRKYDISGTLLWEVADASGTSGLYEKPNWINSDADNNIFVVGNIYSITPSRDYPTDIIALKYSSSGTLLWKTVIPISVLINNASSFSCRSVIDANGNLYIGTAITDGATLYKLDTNGNLIFTNSSTTNAPMNFRSMRIINDKIVMATGGSPVNYVAPIFVYNTSGILLWTAVGIGETAGDVEFDENENVYVLTSVEDAVSPSSGMDMRITKYNSTGTQLWNHDYDFGGAESSIRFVYLNGRISAIGYGASSSSSPYFDWKTFQTDTDGTLIWSAIYDATNFNDEYPHYILAKPTGEVIVTGVGGPSPDPNNPSFIQMPIIQYSETGVQNWISTPNIYGGTGLATMFASDASLYAISSRDMTVYHYNSEPLGVTGYIQNPTSIKVYPNPVVEFTTLEFDVSESQSIQITVFDILGKKVIYIPTKELQPGISKIQLDLTGLKNGLYFCQIKSNGNLQTVKLIKS